MAYFKHKKTGEVAFCDELKEKARTEAQEQKQTFDEDEHTWTQLPDPAPNLKDPKYNEKTQKWEENFKHRLGDKCIFNDEEELYLKEIDRPCTVAVTKKITLKHEGIGIFVVGKKLFKEDVVLETGLHTIFFDKNNKVFKVFSITE